MGLAAKMMEKMGWRGGGLGREQQVPLQLDLFLLNLCNCFSAHNHSSAAKGNHYMMLP
jgi:G-patch domain